MENCPDLASQELSQNALPNILHKKQSSQYQSKVTLNSSSSRWRDSIKEAPRLALPFFILLAALFHLSTIYLFKIVYQPSHVSKPVPAQVLFLPPNSSFSQQISFWLKANDPSIFSPLKTVQATRSPLPDSIYEPGPASLPLRALPLLQKNSTNLLPPSNEPVLPSALTHDTTIIPVAEPPPRQQMTTIQLLDPLSTRTTLTLGTPSIPPAVPLPLPPTKLTLNVDTDGIPHHVIILQSCGNTTADEAATRWAMNIRFGKADHETWGTLIVVWGNK